MDILIRIKRLAFARRLRFTIKAREELWLDNLDEDDVIEAIVNAHRIDKVIRSHSESRTHSGEKLYIIKGLTLANVLVYTKGRFGQDDEGDVFYILISSKRAL